MQGKMLIDGRSRFGSGPRFFAIEARSGESLDPAYGSAAAQDVDDACAAAEAAFAVYRQASRQDRAALLERIAQAILDLGDALIVRAMQETGLARARLEGERARTVGQLRLFGEVIREGTYLDRRLVSALPERAPLPRPDLRMMNIPLGPVAVFGASNFPLAFSVAGGDTAAALAAGCPVVVKAHPAHPGTSELVGQAIAAAVASCVLPGGVFGLVFDAGIEAGARLVADPRIKAVGFTGSARAGLALLRIAQARPEPIPVYAEMSAVNPVLLFPGALQARAEAIARSFVPALTGSCGQLCTAPGLVFGLAGEGFERFLAAVATGIAAVPAATMLTPAIAAAHEAGSARLAAHSGVETLARGEAGGARQGRAGLFATSEAEFLADPVLAEEVFGPTALAVRCRDLAGLERALAAVGGQLTVSLHLAESDYPAARALLALAAEKAGRVIVDGFGSGVEVCPAMVHGGPFPATSDGRTTSVGTRAIDRFLRPVCLQNLPQALLPEDLR